MDNIRSTRKIAIIGGTGKEGKGLAYRWAKAGHFVTIGSRSSERAIDAASFVNQLLEQQGVVVGLENADAAKVSNVIVLTVPYSAHKTTLEYLRQFILDKLIIDVTVPLVPPNVHIHQPPEGGSALQEAANILGDDINLACAFQNISHSHLLAEHSIECDVLVCGTTSWAIAETIELIEDAGMRGFDAGPIENAAVIEGLTSILIQLNKRYKSKSAGLRITGLPKNGS